MIVELTDHGPKDLAITVRCHEATADDWKDLLNDLAIAIYGRIRALGRERSPRSIGLGALAGQLYFLGKMGRMPAEPEGGNR